MSFDRSVPAAAAKYVKVKLRNVTSFFYEKIK